LLCDDDKVAQYSADYKSGTMGYSVAKEKLTLAILDTFKPFEARYHDLKEKPDFVLDVLSDGFRTAKREAADVLEIVRELTGLRGLSRATGNR
jgi:tryptophanyl-tRNA synthetase